MNPVIEAAWIAAGVGALGVTGTVVTAIAGFRNSRDATQRTIEAGAANTVMTLNAARDDRLWELRAAAYEETIASLLYRQTQRQHELRMFRRTVRATERQLDEFLATYQPPGQFEAQARLVAYASDEVRKAFEATRQADAEIRDRCKSWTGLTEAAKKLAPANASEASSTIMKIIDDIKPTLEEAETTDEALVRLIRSELRSPPHVGVALQASARRRWHRRDSAQR